MRRLKQYRKAGTLFLTVFLAVSCSLAGAAFTWADEEKPSLTIEERSATTGELIPGVELSVYRVADMDERGVLKLTGSYVLSGLETDKLGNADESIHAAGKIDGWIHEQGIAADRSAVTDANGILTMTGLERGLYLVLTTGTPGTELTVKSEPFFVSLPMPDAQTGNWLYDITAKPKVTTSQKPDPSDPGNPDDPDDPNNPANPSDPSNPDDPSNPGNPPGPGNPTAPSKPGGAGNHDGGDHSSGGGGKGNPPIVDIGDNPAPLASFPEVPSEPELTLIEDAPVPLAGLPQIPKLGDMGAAGYLAGLFFSLGAGAISLKKRLDYQRREADE